MNQNKSMGHFLLRMFLYSTVVFGALTFASYPSDGWQIWVAGWVIHVITLLYSWLRITGGLKAIRNVIRFEGMHILFLCLANAVIFYFVAIALRKDGLSCGAGAAIGSLLVSIPYHYKKEMKRLKNKGYSQLTDKK